MEHHRGRARRHKLRRLRLLRWVDLRPRALEHRRRAEASLPKRRRSERRPRAPSRDRPRRRAASRARWWASLRRTSAPLLVQVLGALVLVLGPPPGSAAALRISSRPSAPRTMRIRSRERWRSTVRRTSRTSPALLRWPAAVLRHSALLLLTRARSTRRPSRLPVRIRTARLLSVAAAVATVRLPVVRLAVRTAHRPVRIRTVLLPAVPVVMALLRRERLPWAAWAAWADLARRTSAAR
ncbi:MAG: hypothetical protein JWO86_4221 [Myxococcaceae bacterium]|nr:hypothetical protein [Myxococcaceae bacterium]